jgi:hypothetical protein
MLFSERPFVSAGHAHSGTYWHRNAGKEGMYNRVGSCSKVAKGESRHGKQTATVYTPEIRVATVYRTPNYGDLPTVLM